MEGACEYKTGVVGGCGGAEMWGWREICRGGGVIRWMSTNSTILHLDSGSRRHEMSVDSSLFMRLVPFLCWIFLRTKADGRSDSEWPDARDSRNREEERSHETGGSMETTDQNEMCRWTDVLRPLRDRRRWREKWVFERKEKECV